MMEAKTDKYSNSLKSLEQWVERHAKVLGAFLLLIGVLSGFLLGRELKSTETHSISILEVLALFIFLPTLTFIFSLIVRLKFKGSLALRRITPLFGLGYGFGAFASIFFIYLTNFVGAHLSTTFPEIINDTSLSTFVRWSSLPFRILGIDLDIRAMSSDLLSGQGNVTARQLAEYWRNYFLSAICLYTILPRILLVVWPKGRPPIITTSTEVEENIFEIPSLPSSIEDYFILQNEELRLLCSIELQVIENDIQYETDIDLKISKSKWFTQWKNAMNSSLDRPIVEDYKELNKGIHQLDKLYHKMNIIMFEASMFTPYYPLDKESQNANLKLSNKDAKLKQKELCRDFGLDYKLLEKTQVSYQTRLKKYRPKLSWQKLAVIGSSSVAVATLGWAVAPAAAAAFSLKMGLSAASAKLAALALLGSGKLFVGGLSVLGGKAVIIGGGAVLGFSGGTVLTAYFSKGGAHLMASDIARTEAIIFELLQDKIPNSLDFLIERLEKLRNEVSIKLADLENGEDLHAKNFSKKEMKLSLKLVEDRLAELNSPQHS